MKTFVYLLCSLWLSLAVHAAELKFEPATPIVEINKSITLSVANTEGTVKWIAGEGKIQGEGSKVTYLAPEQAGLDAVTVLDSQGNVGVIKVVITLPNNFSPENAQWEVFTNRSEINALLLSDDGKTLWIGTNGGLEQWDTQVGEIKKIWTRLEGLPSNEIIALTSDNNNGLWIVAGERDLVHLDKQGKQQIYFGSHLPYKNISEIVSDGINGIWVNNYEEFCYDSPPFCGSDDYYINSALVYLNYSTGKWTIYREENSKLSGNISGLLVDNLRGVWFKAYQDFDTSGDYTLTHIDSYGEWSIHQADNAEYDLLFNQNKQKNPWVDEDGLIHLSGQENSIIFSRENIGLLSNSFNKFIGDQKNGIWILGNDAILHMDSENKQFVSYEENIDTNNSFSDNRGGVWVQTMSGIVHLDSKLNRDFYNIEDIIESRILDADGSIWIQTEALVSHISINGKRNNFDTDEKIELSSLDKNGGMWIQTEIRLFYINNKMEIQNYSLENILLDNSISDIQADKDGLWMSMSNGSFYYLNHQGKWTNYSSYDELVTNSITIFEPSLKCSDGRGGWWYGSAFTMDDNLEEVYIEIKHRDSQGKVNNFRHNWELININYVGFAVDSEYCDGQGGVWIVTIELEDLYNELDSVRNRVVHLNSQRQWKVYDELGPNFKQVLKDSTGNLWISMSEDSIGGQYYDYIGKGLAFLNSQDQVKIYTKENSKLQSNYIDTFFLDNNGGVWIVAIEDMGGDAGVDWGGAGKGLAHLSSTGELTVYTKERTALPSNNITSTLIDEQGELWIGTDSGLAHVTFGRKTELCSQTEIDTATCQAIQQGKNAAIIIAAGGAQETDSLWENTEAITSRIYRTFYRRGFAKSNIYYLSSKTWADFDGDGFNDRISRINEDRYLKLDDLENAFKWAKGLGKLDQPLYFFFMDHGGEGKLHLAPTLQLSAEDIKPLLDDYQATTGNQLIVVLEACHSGSLIPALTAPNRAIITSAKADEKAYFFEKKGFSRFFTDYLLKGTSFSEAFTLATRDQDKLRGKNLQFQTAGGAGMTTQTPQLDDNNDGKYDPMQDSQWLKTIYINGKFTTADDTLAIENLTPATTLAVGQPIQLQAKATVAQGTVKRVWAVIRPPKMAQVLDTNGTPILAFPRVNLVQSTESPDTWQTTWNDATYNGNYTVTFYAEDNEKNIAGSEQDAILTVSGGIDPPAKAQVQIQLDKTRYQRGEQFKATLTENLGWGYDLYAAIVMPDGNYFTLKNTNELRGVKEAKPWYVPRKQGQPITLLDLPLPTNLPTGQYCIYGILSPEQNDVFEAMNKNLWVYGQQCFEVF